MERPLRYPCLLLDHDDTSVDSTRSVHYPAHVEAMQVLRPNETVVDVETWFAKNFHPGILQYLHDELRLTEEELAVEERIWREHTATGRPSFYPGILEALADYQARGGHLVIVSHSDETVIREHYSLAFDGTRVMPELIFGWELGVQRRKPYPYPVHETVRRLGVAPSDVLVVDDLKPGIDMALAAGVDAAAACWSHHIPEIRQFMQRHCVAVLDTVDEFRELILS